MAGGSRDPSTTGFAGGPPPFDKGGFGGDQIQKRFLREGGQTDMCKARKDVTYTLMLSAGLLVWLTALFSLGAVLMH